MKRALIGIVSMGIFAVSVGVESANAQTYGPYGDSRVYTSRATIKTSGIGTVERTNKGGKS